jgi:hypothetical protein
MSKHSICRDHIPANSNKTFEAFFEWAKTLSSEGILDSFDDDDGQQICWAGTETDIITHGPSKARKLGFLVEEFEGGWSAILPKSETLDPCFKCLSREACYIITAATGKVETQNVIVLDSAEFLWKDDHSPLRKHGWTLNGNDDQPSSPVTYEFNKPAAYDFFW